jgi:glycogen synthase
VGGLQTAVVYLGVPRTRGPIAVTGCLASNRSPQSAISLKESATTARTIGSIPEPARDDPPNAALRLLMVTPRYFPLIGGVENHVHQVARRLARAGVDVTVLTTDPSGRLFASELVDGIRVRRVRAWPANRDYYLAPEIYRIVSRGDWDLVHIQSYHTLVPPIAMLGALRARIPYLVTFHGGGHSSRLRNALRPAQLAALRPLLARAECLVAVASFEVDQFARALRVPRERFALIPNGADLPDVVVKRSSDPDSTGPLIVSVGRLERYKGHGRVIAALPLVLERYPTARLRIFGAGPDEMRLRRLSGRLGVAERVEIRSIPAADRAAMASELSRASLFVLLSEYETHPIAVLEALSVGCPALVADSSGLRELAERGHARATSLQGTDRQVADAVIAQLEHPLVPTRLDLPTWDDCSAGLLALYREIAASRAAVSVE